MLRSPEGKPAAFPRDVKKLQTLFCWRVRVVVEVNFGGAEAWVLKMTYCLTQPNLKTDQRSFVLVSASLQVCGWILHLKLFSHPPLQSPC